MDAMTVRFRDQIMRIFDQQGILVRDVRVLRAGEKSVIEIDLKSIRRKEGTSQEHLDDDEELVRRLRQVFPEISDLYYEFSTAMGEKKSTKYIQFNVSNDDLERVAAKSAADGRTHVVWESDPH